jgi:DNA-binding domain-containing protein, araC-type
MPPDEPMKRASGVGISRSWSCSVAAQGCQSSVWSDHGVDDQALRANRPVAHDFVMLNFVRAGSAILFSEFGEQLVKPGDVILLAANVLCGAEPEAHVTVTTIYADTDYVIDQVFWQHVEFLQDRLHAQDFAATV